MGSNIFAGAAANLNETRNVTHSPAWPDMQAPDAILMCETLGQQALSVGCQLYRVAYQALRIKPGCDLQALSERLIQGLTLRPETACIDMESFFSQISQGYFPINTHIRPLEQLYNADKPDALHDIIGHAPFFYVKEVVVAIRLLASRYGETSSPQRRKQLLTLWFHLFEFGLVIEEGRLAAFGAGLITSRTAFESITQRPVRCAELSSMLDSGICAVGLPTQFFVHESTQALLVFFYRSLQQLEVA